jgi:outer membrane murein-binding lipoprotein Lpp
MRTWIQQLLIAVLSVVLTGCASRSSPDSSSRGAESDRSSCDEGRGLMAVADVLENDSDGCRTWIESAHVRAARVDDRGSASVWTRRTLSEMALLTTAAHVLSPCSVQFAADDGRECDMALRDPTRVRGEFGVRLAEPGGGLPRGKWSAVFPLFNVQTSAEELFGDLGAPRFDVSVYVVGSQDVEPFPSNRTRGPAPFSATPRALHDPVGVTLLNPSWQHATTDERVLTLGFPGTGQHANRLVASVGRVLSDEEAKAAIVLLESAGDVEGRIP